MNFSRFLDIQSWWEVPSIAYFCSLFRTAFNLLDFDIEELEEALLTDGTEECASSLLTELIVRLLNGCLGNNGISTFNYQMYLRRLFRRQCQETGRYNPFNTDIDFQFLPLRTKVEILYALCDFRLDADDVFELFKNLEAESLRVEPLGWDDNDSAYWYFYGTRLYREDVIKKTKSKSKKKKSKGSRKRSWYYGDDWLDGEETKRVWQVVCFTEADWSHLTKKFSKATSRIERELYRSLSQNFLPEIPRLFLEKERLQRKRLLESIPRRTSNRVLQKIKQKKEDLKAKTSDEDNKRNKKRNSDRERRAKRRNLIRSQSTTSNSSEDSSRIREMPRKMKKHRKSHDKKSKNSMKMDKKEPLLEPPVKIGRKTNNSLASATGQILISDNDEPVNSTRKKLKTSQIFSQSEEDIQTDMYKVLEQLTSHEDAWPFMDPVEEEYAPNYYAVIRRPMDLRKMEERLDNGYYTDFSMFKADFKLIVNNCRLYNGQDNEYTLMVDNLQAAFDRLTEKYIHRVSSSDEEIAVEYPMPTPSRKHKLKSSESPPPRKKSKYSLTSDDTKNDTSDDNEDNKNNQSSEESPCREDKEPHKTKEGKSKKKKKGHHRHGKHFKSHKKISHSKSENEDEGKTGKHSKKGKHLKDRKKSKQKRKKKHSHDSEKEEPLQRAISEESLESSNRSRSASPLPSIHTPTPSPTEPEQLSDPNFFKDKYDKIKERRRAAAKDAWESLFDYKQKTIDKQKQNLTIPEKEKNQKLRETIEKLKAKNERYKDNVLFNKLLSLKNHARAIEQHNSLTKEYENTNSLDDATDEDDSQDSRMTGSGNIKGRKKNSTTKNECASEALEEAVKDIRKWLDDAPKGSALSSPGDSPAHTVSTEDQDNSRQDDDFSLSEKGSKKELLRKRPSSRELKTVKRKEIQRTIERLQPGKSKGNLITNIASTQKVEETTAGSPLLKCRDSVKGEDSPKLSLGSVLPTVEFTIGNDHNFVNAEDANTDSDKPTQETEVPEETVTEENPKTEEEVRTVPETIEKPIEKVEHEQTASSKLSQEKATPNLSAWFKAFGTAKGTTTVVKKKVEEGEHEEKPAENSTSDAKPPPTPKNVPKCDSPGDEISPTPEGGDSPIPNVSTTRQRRTSTGSSISERSSFSQDLDSPRHQVAHSSPLLRSPASPRTDDFQKITYPIINGTIRAGFYQDTASMKSSPEKSCSPREAPQSPYSPYSQHVYASNSMMGSSTPNYFVDHNKSPLPTYGQNQPPPYYDSAKAPVICKLSRSHDDYIALGPDTYQQQSQSFSESLTSYSQQDPQSLYSQSSPQPSTSTSTSTALPIAPSKSPLFPAKKRTYNDNNDGITLKSKKALDSVFPSKDDYQKIVQSFHTMATALDNIPLSLNEKSDTSSLKEKMTMDYTERQHQSVDGRESAATYESNIARDNQNNEVENLSCNKQSKKDSMDLINMTYLNPEHERRSSGDNADIDFSPPRELTKNTISSVVTKQYEVDNIAMDLGMGSQQSQKHLNKNNNHTNLMNTSSSKVDMTVNQNIIDFDSIPMNSQTLGNFSLNDIEMANKKLYSCVTPTPTSSGALDYANWKSNSQHRKQDQLLPTDFSNMYSDPNEKAKSNMNVSSSNVLSYNKKLHHQQYHNYTATTSNVQRCQELTQNLQSELKIPNPRGMLKNDSIGGSISTDDRAMISRSANSKKSEKLIQNHPLVSTLQYKTPYSSQSTIQLDNMRNITTIPQMLERYTNDERYMSTFPSGTTSLYNDKTFQMAQMFHKVSTEALLANSSPSVYSQSPISMTKESGTYKTSSNIPSTSHSEAKGKSRKKRISDISQSQQVSVGNQSSYHTPSSGIDIMPTLNSKSMRRTLDTMQSQVSNSSQAPCPPSPCRIDVLSSIKSGMVSGSAFNFGTAAANIGLASGLYSDNAGFTIEDFRNSTANQLIAANYMAAAVAHQRNSTESVVEKLVKPAHQNSSHSASSTFPFMSPTQVRTGYPFVGSDPSSPLYQQYLQQQQELLRQTGAQIMGLYPSGYPSNLGHTRQSYDSINRPSWL